MSKYSGNHDQCPHCGMKYRDFRTGFSYNEVYQMYWSADNAPDTWKYKRRNTVLGKWHEIKKDMWKQHMYEDCPKIAEEEPVPF